MSRKRMIDPEIWDDVKFNSLSREARLLFIGIFNLADDEGRIEGSPEYLRKKIFGYDYDITHEQVTLWSDEISNKKMISKYESNNNKYIAVIKFKKYQTISHPTPSKIPPPNGQKSFNDLQKTALISETFQNIPENSGTFQNIPENSGKLQNILETQNLNVETEFPEVSRSFQKFPEHSALISIVKNSLVKVNIIYGFWNSLEIIVHKKCTDKIKSKIEAALKDYSEDEIMQSMKNYAEILKGDEYYWSYTWSLEEFLQRGIEKFKDMSVAKGNYSGKKPVKSKKEDKSNDHAGMEVIR